MSRKGRVDGSLPEAAAARDAGPRGAGRGGAGRAAAALGLLGRARGAVIGSGRGRGGAGPGGPGGGGGGARSRAPGRPGSAPVKPLIVRS